MIEHGRFTTAQVTDSSNIESVGWRPTDVTRYAVHGTLTVKFRHGAVYRYLGISAQMYARLLAAESMGRYFNSHIKNNKYVYVRID